MPDAWVDHDKTKIGYEIPLTRHFYKYVPPRPLAEIDAEIKQLEAEIQDLLPRGHRVSEFVPLSGVALVRYGLGRRPPESDEGVPILWATNMTGVRHPS